MLCTWACVCALWLCIRTLPFHCYLFILSILFFFVWFDLIWFHFDLMRFFYLSTYACVRHLIAKQSIGWHFSDNFSYHPCIIFAEDRQIKVMSLLRSPIWSHTNVTRYKFKISLLKRQITIEISLSSSSPSKWKKRNIDIIDHHKMANALKNYTSVLRIWSIQMVSGGKQTKTQQQRHASNANVTNETLRNGIKHIYAAYFHSAHL